MATVSIDLVPSAAVIQQDFNNLARRIRTMRPAAEQFVDMAVADIKENFATESSRAGKWVRLAESTVNSSWREGGPKLDPTYSSTWSSRRDQLGTRTRLKASATAKARWQIRSSPSGVDITGTMPKQLYAWAHQAGDGYIPARPYMDLREDPAARADRVFGDWLSKQIASWNSNA